MNPSSAPTPPTIDNQPRDPRQDILDTLLSLDVGNVKDDIKARMGRLQTLTQNREDLSVMDGLVLDKYFSKLVLALGQQEAASVMASCVKISKLNVVYKRQVARWEGFVGICNSVLAEGKPKIEDNDKDVMATYRRELVDDLQETAKEIGHIYDEEVAKILFSADYTAGGSGRTELAMKVFGEAGRPPKAKADIRYGA